MLSGLSRGKRTSEDFSSDSTETCFRSSRKHSGGPGGEGCVDRAGLQSFLRRVGVEQAVSLNNSAFPSEYVEPGFGGPIPGFGSLNEQAWKCFGELNLLLQSYQYKFNEVALRSYHSFTRAPKLSVFQKLAAAHGCRSQQEYLSHPHLQMVSFILERTYQPYEQASICEYGFLPPNWMHSWCQKYGWAPGSSMTILAVHCYASQPEGCRYSYRIGEAPASALTQGRVHTIYVPVRR